MKSEKVKLYLAVLALAVGVSLIGWNLFGGGGGASPKDEPKPNEGAPATDDIIAEIKKKDPNLAEPPPAEAQPQARVPRNAIKLGEKQDPAPTPDPKPE